MSVCDRHGAQVDPDNWTAPPLTAEDALQVARAVMHNEGLPEDERIRLMWAVLDAGRFGLPSDDQ